MKDYIFIILLIVILIIIYYFFNIEGFQISPFYIENLKMYYLKEYGTDRVLLANNLGQVGFYNFITSNQLLPINSSKGFPLVLSKDPQSYLPLRSGNDPNVYLIANYDGRGIRLVANPPALGFKIEVINYKGYNILGFTRDSNIYQYIKILADGSTSPVIEPDLASKVEIII